VTEEKGMVSISRGTLAGWRKALLTADFELVPGEMREILEQPAEIETLCTHGKEQSPALTAVRWALSLYNDGGGYAPKMVPVEQLPDPATRTVYILETDVLPAAEVERLREFEDAYNALEGMVDLAAKAVGDNTGLMWMKIQQAFLVQMPSMRKKLEEQEGLLRLAREFIVNGVENGYIRMPDADTPDPAHDMVPMLNAALGKDLPVCEHEWVDARNQVIKSGELCPKCGAVRPGNQEPQV